MRYFFVLLLFTSTLNPSPNDNKILFLEILPPLLLRTRYTTPRVFPYRTSKIFNIIYVFFFFFFFLEIVFPLLFSRRPIYIVDRVIILKITPSPRTLSFEFLRINNTRDRQSPIINSYMVGDSLNVGNKTLLFPRGISMRVPFYNTGRYGFVSPITTRSRHESKIVRLPVESPSSPARSFLYYSFHSWNSYFISNRRIESPGTFLSSRLFSMVLSTHLTSSLLSPSALLSALTAQEIMTFYQLPPHNRPSHRT